MSNNNEVITLNNLIEFKEQYDNKLADTIATEDAALKEYVDEYGGKIDTIEVNGVEQTIVNKVVNLPFKTVNSQAIEGTGNIQIDAPIQTIYLDDTQLLPDTNGKVTIPAEEPDTIDLVDASAIDITTTVNSSSTDNQIPTAKACADADDALSDRITVIENDYLTSTDKTELQGNIDTVQGNVNTEVTARQEADTALDTRIDDIDAVMPSDATSSNKLTTQDYVAKNGGKIDTIDLNGTPLTIVNKNVSVNAATSIEIDGTAYSVDNTGKISLPSSEADLLSIEDEPTEDSENLVTSGGVYDALATKTDLTNIADEYDNTLTYAVGDVVIYQGQVYKCKTAVTVAEDFDSTK